MTEPTIISKYSSDVLILTEALSSKNKGDVLTYDELSELVQAEVRSGGRGYQALYRARTKCITDHSKVWEPLSDHTGLKCLTDKEILSLEPKALKSIRRKARKANHKLVTADWANLTDEQQSRLSASMALNAVLEESANAKSVKILQKAMKEPRPMQVSESLSLLRDSASKMVSQ